LILCFKYYTLQSKNFTTPHNILLQENEKSNTNSKCLWLETRNIMDLKPIIRCETFKDVLFLSAQQNDHILPHLSFILSYIFIIYFFYHLIFFYIYFFIILHLHYENILLVTNFRNKKLLVTIVINLYTNL